MTNLERVHAALRREELTRAELRERLGMSERQVDSAISLLIKWQEIKHNGVPGQRTYVAVTASCHKDGRGKSSGSRAGLVNLEKSPKRAAPVMREADWPIRVHGGEQPRPVLRHALDKAWPFFPHLAKRAK